jgi:hypothetical protein
MERKGKSGIMSNKLKNVTGSIEIDAKQARMLKSIGDNAPSRLGVFKAVYAKKASMRQCIKAFCFDCMGFDSRAVGNCTSTQCALHGKRPYQKKGA